MRPLRFANSYKASSGMRMDGSNSSGEEVWEAKGPINLRQSGFESLRRGPEVGSKLVFDSGSAAHGPVLAYPGADGFYSSPVIRIYTVAASFFPDLSACATGPKRFDSLFGLKHLHHVGVGIAVRYDQCGVDTRAHCLSSRSRRHGASRPVQRSHTWGVAKRT